VYEETLDWKQVQNDYDYVWAYGVPRFSAALAGIGERVYSFNELEVYRIRKLQGGSAKESTPPISANH
jgi:hypothetical protein